MEELISRVPEKDTANYLREAFVCYGASAYRGCIVLTHIALFEGLRRKLQAVATVNIKAKEVLRVIEPLASAQKVFESKLIEVMKAGGVITSSGSEYFRTAQQTTQQSSTSIRPCCYCGRGSFCIFRSNTKILIPTDTPNISIGRFNCRAIVGNKFFSKFDNSEYATCSQRRDRKS